MTRSVSAFLNSWDCSDSRHITHLIRLAMLIKTQIIRSWIVPHFIRASQSFFPFHRACIITRWWTRQVMFYWTAFHTWHDCYFSMQWLRVEAVGRCYDMTHCSCTRMECVFTKESWVGYEAEGRKFKERIDSGGRSAVGSNLGLVFQSGCMSTVYCTSNLPANGYPESRTIFVFSD